MIRVNLIVLLLISTVVPACREEINIEAEKEAITKVIHNSIGWAKNKDLSLLYGALANDPEFIEVHPDNSVVKGIDQFRENESFWMSPDFKAIRYEITDLSIKLSESGTTAWWYCMLDDINEWKGQPANWEHTRWTGVCEKRNGKWVIVMQHFSFASGDS